MDFELTPEQQFIRQTVREFAEKEIAPKARYVDEHSAFPSETFAKMAQLGLMGLPFPEEYGGAGADSVSTAIAIEEVARCCGSTALAYAAHIGLGSAPIAMFGTEEQKRRFLAPAARGEYLAAFGLTEPHAGSDAGATRTTARLVGDEWVINGQKNVDHQRAYCRSYHRYRCYRPRTRQEGHLVIHHSVRNTGTELR